MSRKNDRLSTFRRPQSRRANPLTRTAAVRPLCYLKLRDNLAQKRFICSLSNREALPSGRNLVRMLIGEDDSLGALANAAFISRSQLIEFSKLNLYFDFFVLQDRRKRMKREMKWAGCLFFFFNFWFTFLFSSGPRWAFWQKWALNDASMKICL